MGRGGGEEDRGEQCAGTEEALQQCNPTADFMYLHNGNVNCYTYYTINLIAVMDGIARIGGCIQYLSAVSVLIKGDGGRHSPSLERHTGLPAQKLSNVLLWNLAAPKCKCKSFYALFKIFSPLFRSCLKGLSDGKLKFGCSTYPLQFIASYLL